ncbi:hypothetical protein PSTT_04833 [Puccinia striiformis]|uniref:Uncharacterized protein n=4 Tax=Puccinia striiformis TaxID=27350 RepID=A0A2S4VR92_9BASI|nr:hypothetical protein PSTT_04833 [Puccinia striiformis]
MTLASFITPASAECSTDSANRAWYLSPYHIYTSSTLPPITHYFQSVIMSETTSTTTVSSKIRLNSTNYLGWIVQMQARLRRLDVLDVVLGRSVKPEKPEAAADWSAKNETAYFEIVEHVDIEHLTLIGGAVPPDQQFDGQFVWTFLKSKYAANDDVAKLVALEALNDLEFTTVPDFVRNVRGINQRLILANFDLGDRLRNLMVLAKLPRGRFQSFRDIITMGFATENFESLLRRLENYAAQNKISEDELNRPEQAALLTLSNHQLTCPSCKKMFRVCTHCNKTGHTSDNCYLKHPDKRPSANDSAPQAHYSQHNEPVSTVPTDEENKAYFLQL